MSNANNEAQRTYTLTGPYDEQVRNLTAQGVLNYINQTAAQAGTIRLVAYPTNSEGRHDLTNTGHAFTIKIKS